MNIRKIITVVLYGILTVLIGFLVLQFTQQRQKNRAITEQMQTLPDFTFYRIDGTLFKRDNLPHGQALCLIYMDPGCGFCTEETKEIIKHIDRFGETNVLFVSHVDVAELQRFADEYGLDAIPQIRLLHDGDYRFADWFGRAVTPSVYIYDEQRQLVKTYSGQTKIEAILKHL